MTSMTTHSNSDFIPVAPPRANHAGPIYRLRQWISQIWNTMPRLTSHEQALRDLADGYDRLAQQCEERDDPIQANCYRRCARELRVDRGNESV